MIRVMLPRSRSESTMVSGIRSANSFARTTTKFPAFRFFAIFGASIVNLQMPSAIVDFSIIRFPINTSLLKCRLPSEEGRPQWPPSGSINKSKGLLDVCNVKDSRRSQRAFWTRSLKGLSRHCSDIWSGCFGCKARNHNFEVQEIPWRLVLYTDERPGHESPRKHQIGKRKLDIVADNSGNLSRAMIQILESQCQQKSPGFRSKNKPYAERREVSFDLDQVLFRQRNDIVRVQTIKENDLIHSTHQALAEPLIHLFKRSGLTPRHLDNGLTVQKKSDRSPQKLIGFLL